VGWKTRDIIELILIDGSPMTTLSEIKSAIQQLPESDIRQLSEWIHAYVNEIWDQQIKSDLASGKLARLVARAEEDIADNRVKDLNEVFQDLTQR
jgi:hypothetical protein